MNHNREYLLTGISIDSFVSMFNVLWRQTEMYEKSQEQLHSAEYELANMKEYLKCKCKGRHTKEWELLRQQVNEIKWKTGLPSG